MAELQAALDELRRGIEQATVAFVQRMDEIDQRFGGDAEGRPS